MKKRTSILMCTFFVFTLIPHLSCTIIGLATGATIDARQPKNEKTIRSQEIAEIKKNALITVYRKNLEPITGFYRGSISTGDSKATAIFLDKKGGKFEQYQIPYEQIDHIYIPPRKSIGKLIGSEIGAAIDITLLILFSNSEWWG